MECLQYMKELDNKVSVMLSFKPCYKWNAFNTIKKKIASGENNIVLNLVINGMPSIQDTISQER